MDRESLDMMAAAELVAELAGSDLDPGAGMRRLVTWCASQLPHPDWPRLAALDFDAELVSLGRWLEKLLRSEPPDRSVTGLYFGLFNPASEDGVPSADIYVAGAIHGPGEWLADVGEHWWPVGRYAHSDLLDRVYRIAYGEGGLENEAEYPVLLGFGVLAAKRLCQELSGQLLTGGRTELWIAAGWESGDILTLGRLTPAGLALSPAW